jgi:hypothetical protein
MDRARERSAFVILRVALGAGTDALNTFGLAFPALPNIQG